MNSTTTDTQIYIYLERLGNLIRAQEQAIGNQHGLQPRQLRMLYYLSICNRYSDTPAAVTEYMQLTKGTVSQSLKILETRGYIKKQADPRDKRVVHLLVTTAGEELLRELPPALLVAANVAMGTEMGEEMVVHLQQLLQAMQGANQLNGFGVCRTCHHHQPLNAGRFRCGLTLEILTTAEADFICREHLQPQTTTDM